MIMKFSYGGAHNVKMYDEETPINSDENYAEENGDDPSTIFVHGYIYLQY